MVLEEEEVIATPSNFAVPFLPLFSLLSRHQLTRIGAYEVPFLKGASGNHTMPFLLSFDNLHNGNTNTYIQINSPNLHTSMPSLSEAEIFWANTDSSDCVSAYTVYVWYQ